MDSNKGSLNNNNNIIMIITLVQLGILTCIWFTLVEFGNESMKIINEN